MLGGNGSVIRKYGARAYPFGANFVRVGGVICEVLLCRGYPDVIAGACGAKHNPVRRHIEVIDGMGITEGDDVLEAHTERIRLIKRRRETSLIKRVGEGDLFGGIERLVVSRVYEKSDLVRSACAYRTVENRHGRRSGVQLRRPLGAWSRDLRWLRWGAAAPGIAIIVSQEENGTVTQSAGNTVDGYSDIRQETVGCELFSDRRQVLRDVGVRECIPGRQSGIKSSLSFSQRSIASAGAAATAAAGGTGRAAAGATA